MDCYLFVLLIFGSRLCCTSTRKHGKSDHSSLAADLTEPKKKELLQNKKFNDHYHSLLHKKEEMLGQDSMRINEAEFKLQSLVSPEFHQGSKALHSGKVYGNMEVNTLSPEQVDFVQTTSQWPKFYNPQSKEKTPSKIIYPEDPVLFPQEKESTNPNYNNNGNNWVEMGGDSFKQGMSPYSDDTSIASMLSMSTGTSTVGNEFLGQTHRKSNPMTFEERPGFMANQNAPIDDKMPSLSDIKLNDDINKLSLEAKNIMGFGNPSKDSISSFIDGGELMKTRGKPIGILGNILKASQSMPTGRIIKSSKSESWFNDGLFSRRHILERSKYIAPAEVRSASPSVRHTIQNKHKQRSKIYQKTTKKRLSKKSKL